MTSPPETPHSDQQVPLPSPPMAGTVFQHYKGHQYKVLGTLLHEATQEVLVRYQRVIRESWPRKGWAAIGGEFAREVALWHSQTETGAKRWIEIPPEAEG